MIQQTSISFYAEKALYAYDCISAMNYGTAWDTLCDLLRRNYINPAMIHSADDMHFWLSKYDFDEQHCEFLEYIALAFIQVNHIIRFEYSGNSKNEEAAIKAAKDNIMIAVEIMQVEQEPQSIAIPDVLVELVYPTRKDGCYLWKLLSCPYCGKKHLHGAGTELDEVGGYLGHRTAHCVGKHNQSAGYRLVRSSDE